MTTINDIIEFTETFAPLDTAMSFDNCGLLVGDKDTTAEAVLVCLDITPDVVSEAEDLRANLIISHHPVIFNGIKQLSQSDVPYLLAQKGISALCLHTNLDLSEKFGVNTCLAEKLELNNMRFFMDGEKEICLAAGDLKTPLNERQFAEFVKLKLGCKGVRFTEIGNTVSRVAVSSGAGGSEIYNALNTGAQVLVTGEIKHNQILDACRMGLSVVDAGHFKTENVVIKPLTEKLNRRFDGVNFYESKTCTDCMNYI